MTLKHVLEELQESIHRRFSSVPKPPEPVVYEFTEDRGRLHQYYRIREIMYRKVFHTDKFVGTEDVYDKLSHILIARRGNLCLGGCRLTIREADEDFMLPLETDEFKLRDVMPDLPLRQLRHGEISRFAVMDEDDNRLDIMLGLSQLIIAKCVNEELGLVFLKSSMPMARNWRRIIDRHCGQQDVSICSDVKVPEIPIHPEIIWYITKVVLPAARKASIMEKPVQLPDILQEADTLST